MVNKETIGSAIAASIDVIDAAVQQEEEEVETPVVVENSLGKVLDACCDPEHSYVIRNVAIGDGNCLFDSFRYLFGSVGDVREVKKALLTSPYIGFSLDVDETKKILSGDQVWAIVTL